MMPFIHIFFESWNADHLNLMNGLLPRNNSKLYKNYDLGKDKG